MWIFGLMRDTKTDQAMLWLEIYLLVPTSNLGYLIYRPSGRGVAYIRCILFLLLCVTKMTVHIIFVTKIYFKYTY